MNVENIRIFLHFMKKREVMQGTMWLFSDSREWGVGTGEWGLGSRDSEANSQQPGVDSPRTAGSGHCLTISLSHCLPYSYAILEGIETAALSIWLTSPYRREGIRSIIYHHSQFHCFLPDL